MREDECKDTRRKHISRKILGDIEHKDRETEAGPGGLREAESASRTKVKSVFGVKHFHCGYKRQFQPVKE